MRADKNIGFMGFSTGGGIIIDFLQNLPELLVRAAFLF
jgi:hypothetical protein